MDPGSPASLHPRRLAWIIAAVIFIALLNSMIIGPAMPLMALSFGVEAVELSIGITIYLLVLTVLLPTAIWIAERYDARRVFALAIAGFTLASVGVGLTHNLWQFVAARALQGIAGAFMVPVGNQILLRLTDKKDLVSVMNISTAPALAAPVIGPPIGGFIADWLSWHWIFFINLPLGATALWLSLKHIPHTQLRDSSLPHPPFDTRGFLLTGLALTGIIYGLTRVPAGGTDRWFAATLVVAGAVLLVPAIRHAQVHPRPVVPLGPLRIQTFRVASLTGGGLAKISFFAMGFVLPLMMQIGLGRSPSEAGLLLLGWNLGELALKLVAIRTLQRAGFRRTLRWGVALMAVTMTVWLLFSPRTPFWLLFAAFAANGMCRSFLFTGMLSLVYSDVPRHEMGAAIVLNNLGTAVMASLGVSLAAVVLHGSAALRGAEHIMLPDFQIAVAVAAAACLAGLIPFTRLARDAGAAVIVRPRAPTAD